VNQFILKLRILLLQNKFYLILFILTTAFSLIFTNYIKRVSIYNDQDTNFNLKINAYKIDGNKLTLELKGKENLIGNYYFKTLEEKEAFANVYDIGDEISVSGELKKPKNNTIPNTSNYKKYLYNKNIHYVLKIKDFEKKKKNRNIFLKLKNFFYQRTKNIENNEYIYALVLGNSYHMESEVKDSYRTNGIIHLFSLSGLHVSLISFILLKLKKRLT